MIALTALLVLVTLFLMAYSGYVDRLIGRATRATIGRYTSLDIRDYAALLSFQNDFEITEIQTRPGEWIVGRPLSDLHLTNEGVLVLGIHRAGGGFVGASRGGTVIEPGDQLVAYGRTNVLQDLATRPTSSGDMVHDRMAEEHRRLLGEDGT